MKCVNIRRMIALLWPIDLRRMLDPVVPDSISRPAAQQVGESPVSRRISMGGQDKMKV
jgi:hypothetical protein